MLPSHIGFIMDGNRRWAKANGKSVQEGHRAGVETMKRLVAVCREKHIAYVSVYAFSTENWKRTATEINGIFALVEEFAIQAGQSVRLFFSGNVDTLPKKVSEAIRQAEIKTAGNSDITLNICLNYGGKDEILQAVNRLLEDGITHVDAKTLESKLYTGKLPPLDMIVRTGGEKRLSNFMLYSAAYAELFFTDTLWPAYDEYEFYDMLSAFSERVRKFGGN